MMAGEVMARAAGRVALPSGNIGVLIGAIPFVVSGRHFDASKGIMAVIDNMAG